MRALADLAGRLHEGRRGQATDELMQYCREMAQILSAAVDQLGQGAEEIANRAAATHMLAGLAEMEGHLKGTHLH